MRTTVPNTRLTPAQERTLRAFPRSIGWVDALEWCRALKAPLRAPTVKVLVDVGFVSPRYPNDGKGVHQAHRQYRITYAGLQWLKAKDAGKI